MGNRAVITASKSTRTGTGLYLHWSGDPASVLAFLEAAKQLGVRDPKNNGDYFLARLSQLVGNYFGGTLSLGFGMLKELDTSNGDNGTYVVAEGFKIVKRYGSGADSDYGAMRFLDLSAQQQECYHDVLKQTLKANRKFFKEES